jgi:type IV secretory pathway VirB3-like protein
MDIFYLLVLLGIFIIFICTRPKKVSGFGGIYLLFFIGLLMFVFVILTVLLNPLIIIFVLVIAIWIRYLRCY